MGGTLTAHQIFHLFSTFASLLAADNCPVTISSLKAMRKSHTCHFIIKAVKSLYVII